MKCDFCEFSARLHVHFSIVKANQKKKTLKEGFRNICEACERDRLVRARLGTYEIIGYLY